MHDTTRRQRSPPSPALCCLVAAVTIYAAYVPVALWVEANYDARQRTPPPGAVVHLGLFNLVPDEELTDDVRKLGRKIYKTSFRWTQSPGLPSEEGIRDPHVLLYENDRSLGSPFIQYLDYSKSYTFTFSTSDDTDPLHNGRDYWVVRR